MLDRLAAKITGQSFDSATALRSFLNEAKAHMGDELGADKNMTHGLEETAKHR